MENAELWRRLRENICLSLECSARRDGRVFCKKHYFRFYRHGDPSVVKPPGRTPRPLADRFWPKVRKTEACWLWMAYISADGYGRIYVHETRSYSNAHRVAWELVNGTVTEGLVIDHLCRNPACVRPSHLEAVSQRENAYRGDSPLVARRWNTHCARGHAYTPANTTLTKRGTRRCRKCRSVVGS